MRYPQLMEKDRIKKGIRANSRRLLNLLHSTAKARGMRCQDEGFFESLTVHWLVKMCSTWGGPKEDWLRKVNMVWFTTFTTVGSTKIVQNHSKPKFIPKLPEMIPKSSKTCGREEGSWDFLTEAAAPVSLGSSVQLAQTVFERLLTDSH